MHILLPQSVDHFNMVEVDEYTSACAAGNVSDSICLDCHLHIFERSYDRQFEMVAWFSYRIKKRASSEINANMTFLHDVKTVQENYG